MKGQKQSRTDLLEKKIDALIKKHFVVFKKFICLIYINEFIEYIYPGKKTIYWY